MKKVTAVTLAALMVCNVALAGNNMNTRPTMRERINRILQESGLHVFLEDKDTKNDVQMGNELQDKDLESQEVIEPIENEPEVVEEAKKVREQFAMLIKQAQQNSEPAASSKKEPSEQLEATLEKDKPEENQNVFNKELDTSNVFNNYDTAESQEIFGLDFEPDPGSNILFDETPVPEDDAVHFEYSAGSTYRILCRPGFITDVKFQPGEKIQRITAADRTNWQYKHLTTADGVFHLYLSPSQYRLETNVIVITDRHNYQLMLGTAKNFHPIVCWDYPQEYYEQQDPKSIPLEVESVDALDFGYNVSRGETYAWTPEFVFNDGFRTFIKLPEGSAAKYRPVLLLNKRGRLVLGQYSIKNDSLVVGELIDEAILVVGKAASKKTVRINKQR